MAIRNQLHDPTDLSGAGSAGNLRRFPHLRAVAIALLAIVMFLALLGAWADRYVHTVAPNGYDEVVKGSRMIKTALNRQDMVVLMGSSELVVQDDFKASRVFAGEPSGFSVFVIAGGYRQSIHHFMTVAAAGNDLKGKRIVMFVSHTWFTPTISPDAYRRNFSLLQAYEFAFSSPLSTPLKRRGAQRLLELGAPATDDQLLNQALHALADGDTVKYDSLWPMGQASLVVQRIKSDVATVDMIQAKRLVPDSIPPERQRMDWDQMISAARDHAMAESTSNEFGIRDDVFARLYGPDLEAYKDSQRSFSLLNSTEYADLTMTIDALKELKAKPVFVILPMMGRWEDYTGHSFKDRQAYYERVRSLIENEGMPVIDFSQYEYEPGFMRDPWHPGWNGNMRINQALDEHFGEPTKPAK